MIRLLAVAAGAIDRLRDWLCILGVVSLVMLVAVQVFFRYVMNSPLAWPEEVARYVYVWVAFLGIAKVAREQRLYAIDFFIIRTGRRVRSVVECLMTIATIGFFSTALYSAWIVMAANGRIRTGTGLPVNVLYAAMPVASVLIILALVGLLLQQLREVGASRVNGANVGESGD